MDYAAIASSATTQVTAALAAAIPIAGVILGSMVGYRIFKHFVK